MPDRRYEGVQGLGTVAVTRHAQERLVALGVSRTSFEKALLHPVKPDIPDGHSVVWRERNGLRLVITTSPDRAIYADDVDVVVTTAFRVIHQASTRAR